MSAVYSSVHNPILRRHKKWKSRSIQLTADRDMDALNRFTLLKIEGEKVADIAITAGTLEASLSGLIVMDGDEPAWSMAFIGNGPPSQQLKSIELDNQVTIVRDKAMRQLKFFGSPNKLPKTQQDIVFLIKTVSEDTYIIDLDPEGLDWMREQGMQRTISLLGGEVASLDFLTDPKTVIITGNESQLHDALDVVQKKGQVSDDKTALIADTPGEYCAVCWTKVEILVLTSCNHTYCLECFEYLSVSGASDDEPFSVCCEGDIGRCGKVFSLRELQENITSFAFEMMLELSFTSFIHHNYESFRHCPTTNCGQLYRCSMDINPNTTAGLRTCLKCRHIICNSCHGRHIGVTCADYENYHAMEKWKRDHNIKDCPKCGASMEKSPGHDYVMCPGCESELCWICMARFPADGRVRQHLNDAHGGTVERNN